MRRIPIADESGRLRPEAATLLSVYAGYPEDETSREHCLMIALHDLGRAESKGEIGFRPSDPGFAIYKSIENKAGRFVICGLVAVVMVLQRRWGRRVSLNNSAKIVARLLGDTRKLPGLQLTRDGVLSECSRSLSTDQSDIAKIFREYRSVAHIFGAIICAHDCASPVAYWVRAPEFERCLIRTAAVLEHELSSIPGFKTWDIWSLHSDTDPRLPLDLEGYPALSPSADLIDAIRLASDDVLTGRGETS